MLPTERRHLVALAVAACAAIVISGIALALLPVPQHFKLREVAVYDLSTTCSGILTSQGTRVQFGWSAPTPVLFGAWSCALNSLVYTGNGTYGSDSFISEGGVYEFGTICPGNGYCTAANVSGSFSGPILPF
jgi:hypothetical protein